MESDEVPPATTKKYLNYGLPRLGSSALLNIIDLGLFLLYTGAYGVHPFLAGVAMGMGKLAIAISQFLMGWLSDKINTKMGRRKPFMVLGAPIVAITFMLVLMPHSFLSSPSIMDLFVWMLIWDFVFQFFYGELTTPYQSWMAEQFVVHERPKASAFQNFFGFFGTAVGVVITFIILPEVIDTFPPLTSIFSFIIIELAITVVVLYFICAVSMPVEKVETAKMNFIQDVKKIIRDKNFMRVCLLQGIAFLAWGMVTTTLIGFVQYVLGFETTELYIAAGVLFIGVLSFIFLWKKSIDIKGKKQTISMIFLFAVIVLPFSLMGLIPGGVHMGIAIAYTACVAAALGGWYLFPYIWYADLAEDAKRRGDLDGMKAGLYAGFPNILLNIFQAIALIITGAILSLPNVPGQTFSWGYVLWGVWCSIILFIGYLYIKRYITLDFDWEKEVKKFLKEKKDPKFQEMVDQKFQSDKA